MKLLAPAAILLVTATLAGAVLQPIRNGLLENNLRGGTNRIVEVADPIDPLDVVNYQTFLGGSASDWLALTNRPTFPSWTGPAGVSSNGVNGEVYIGTNVPAGGTYDDGWTNSLGDLAWLDSVSNAPPLNWAGPAGVVSQAVDGVVYIGTNTPAGGSAYDDSWTNGVTQAIYGDYAGITNPPAIPGAYDDSWTGGLDVVAFAGEVDPVWSVASNAVTTQAAQGATAYGWGDHGTNGYVTGSELNTATQPVWSAINSISNVWRQAAVAGAAMFSSVTQNVLNTATYPTNSAGVSMFDDAGALNALTGAYTAPWAASVTQLVFATSSVRRNTAGGGTQSRHDVAIRNDTLGAGISGAGTWADLDGFQYAAYTTVHWFWLKGGHTVRFYVVQYLSTTHNVNLSYYAFYPTGVVK